MGTNMTEPFKPGDRVQVPTYADDDQTVPTGIVHQGTIVHPTPDGYLVLLDLPEGPIRVWYPAHKLIPSGDKTLQVGPWVYIRKGTSSSGEVWHPPVGLALPCIVHLPEGYCCMEGVHPTPEGAVQAALQVVAQNYQIGIDKLTRRLANVRDALMALQPEEEQAPLSE